MFNVKKFIFPKARPVVPRMNPPLSRGILLPLKCRFEALSIEIAFS
jgi:hypothetical protein